MAIINTSSRSMEPPLTFNSVDTPIGGKLMIAQLVLPEPELMYRIEADIKYELATKLAEGMLKNNFVQFTKMDDTITGKRIFKARCYLAESDAIKILRTVTHT